MFLRVVIPFCLRFRKTCEVFFYSTRRNIHTKYAFFHMFLAECLCLSHKKQRLLFVKGFTWIVPYIFPYIRHVPRIRIGKIEVGKKTSEPSACNHFGWLAHMEVHWDFWHLSNWSYKKLHMYVEEKQQQREEPQVHPQTFVLAAAKGVKNGGRYPTAQLAQPPKRKVATGQKRRRSKTERLFSFASFLPLPKVKGTFIN